MNTYEKNGLNENFTQTVSYILNTKYYFLYNSINALVELS